MAIYGNLQDLPFPELLTLVGGRTGKLFIYDFIGGKNYEWHLDKSTICGLVVNKTPLDDVMQVRGCMLNLIEDYTSNFEFYRHTEDKLLRHFSLPTEHLVLSTATAIDEVKAYRRHFPNEKVQFIISREADVQLDDQMTSFWNQRRGFLEQGGSAELVAQALRLNLEQVQLFFYKLSAAGMIAPMRRYEPPEARPPGANQTASLEPSSRGPLSTSLQSPLLKPLPASDPFGPIPGTLPEKNNSLVRRMLDALSIPRPGRR